jgi:2-C-methyl-D-erythritol 4-phosphate cytidylyltransferase
MQAIPTIKGRVHGLALILTAGGLGLRMGTTGPKQFVEVQGQPILDLALERLPQLLSLGLRHVILSYPAGYRETTSAFLERLCERDSRFSLAPGSTSAECILECCEGGSTRQQSVRNALEILAQHPPKTVFVHDAVRPLASFALYQRLFDALTREQRGAVPLIPVVDTLKQVNLKDGTLTGTLDRETIFRVQTPQLFHFDSLLELHRRAEDEGFLGTDDASLFEHFEAGSVVGIEGEMFNLKLTTPDDLRLAECWLKEKP